MATAEEILDVRALIPDTDAIYGTGEDEYLFDDETIERFFRLAGDNAIRAAGMAMVAVGNSEALIGKVIITQDLETDAAKLQKEWRDSGALMMKRADEAERNVTADMIDFGEGWTRPELTEAPWDGTWPYGY